MDPEGLRRIAAGDPEGVRQLYGEVAGPAFALIRRLVRDWAAAEDVFQDSMLAVLQNAGAWREEAPFGVWVRQLVLRRCLMHLRSPWQRARLALVESVEGGLEPASGEMPAADLLDLERALAHLSSTARAVLWLHDAEGLTHEEIAAAFGRSPSFSKSQLARAHASMRELLGPAKEAPCQVMDPATVPSR